MTELFIKYYQYYKSLGDKTFEQLSEEDVFWQNDPGSNSIAVIVQHLSGNMVSRWTRFQTEDGEKSWRNRDHEFEVHLTTKDEVVQAWEKGWGVLFEALDTVTDEQLCQRIEIRGEPHTVADAVLRQIAHYAYHVGQMVFIAKLKKESSWKSLSIPRNESGSYNEKTFRRHDTDPLPQHSSPVCFAEDDEVRDEYRTDS